MKPAKSARFRDEKVDKGKPLAIARVRLNNLNFSRTDTMTIGINSSHAGKGDLTQGPVAGHLARLTLPMIWGILSILSFQLVNVFFISRLGTAPLAAITFTFPVTYVVFSIVMGLSIGMSSVISRLIGQGDREDVRRITTHGLILTLLTGLALAVAGSLLMNPLFRLMGADAAMLPLIRDYMGIWFAGSAFFAMPMVGNAAIRAGGDSAVPAKIMIAIALINIALDPLLIFGLFGFPRLELQGAAIANVAASFCGSMASLYVLYARKKMIDREHLSFARFKDSVRRLGAVALPVSITGMIQPAANAVIIALLATYGAEAIAAFGVASRMEAFAFTVIMALATGMAPIIGQNWGAGRFDRVHETLNKALLFAACWSVFIAAIFMIFAKPLAALFAGDDAPAMVHTAALYFWIVALTYAPGNLVPGWGSAFNAMGMPVRSFTMNFVKLVMIQTPLAFAGGALFGMPGIFGAIAVTNVLTGIGFHVWNLRACANSEKGAALAA